MTLLSIAQDILNETKESNIPVTIISNNQAAAKQILQALTISIKTLSREFDWQELQKEHTFNTAASDNDYSLPTDFDRFIENTFWNTTTNEQVLGPLTPQEWRSYTDSTVSNSTISDYFRVRGNEILIFPTPTGVESMTVEYVSKNIVESSGGSGQTDWAADDDVPVIDDLILRLDATWRILKMQGRPYAEEQREADLALSERFGVNGSRKTIRHNSHRGFDPSTIGYPAIVTQS